MLRFFAIRNIPFNNLNILRRQKLMCLQNKSFSTQVNLIKCIRDRDGFHGGIEQQKFNYKIDKRFQSTRHNFGTLLKKKRKRRTNAKYVELLQVTNASTKQIKTKVKNLKAQTLSDFIQKNDNFEQQKEKHDIQINKNKKELEYQMINLEMYNNSLNNNQNGNYDEKPFIFVGKEGMKIKNINEILESIQNFKETLSAGMIENDVMSTESFRSQETATAENEKLSDDHEIIADELETLNELEQKENLNNDTNTSKIKEKKFNAKQHRSAEDEKAAKEMSLKVNLASYINVCVSTGMINRAFSTLMTYRNQYNAKNDGPPSFIGISVYNTLLHGYAEKGNLNKIKEILNIMQNDGIILNHQSFAAIFECFGRLEMNDNNLIELQKYVKKLKNLGLTFNDILDKSKFHSDQREIVLDAIYSIEPNFQPIYTPPKLTYNNILLEKLNKDIESLDVSLKTTNLDENGNEFTKTKYKNRIGYSAEKLKQLANEQLKVELGGSVSIPSIEETTEPRNSEYYRKQLDELLILWKSQICSAINRDINTLRARTRHRPNFMTYLVYLKALDTGQYADILLKEIKILAEGSETFSPTVTQLYRELGNKVRTRYLVEQKQKNGVLYKIGDIYSEYCNNLENSQTNENLRQIWQRVVHLKKSEGPNVDLDEFIWPNNVSLFVGKFLYNILMRDIKIDVNIMKNRKITSSETTTTVAAKPQNLLPAFYTLFRNHNKAVKEEIKPHPVLARLLRASQQQTLTFDANLIPMLCPPLPWSSPVNGGYLLTKSDLIRLPSQAVQQWQRINSSKPEDLYPALDSLNQLSSIPWRVNTDVLDIILKVFNDGGDMKLGIPNRSNSLPPLPEITLTDNSNSSSSPSSSSAKQMEFHQKMILRRKQAEMYSLWCDTLYRLSLANYYRDKVFWLPHNMDFRGRVYPIPPHLNHLGSDMARSMLVFDQAQPLGPDGFTWLKLHCINLTGLKKRESVRERLLYAEEIMDDILDSADNPLTGRKWWTKSDEPWQTLACCIEIAKVKRSPDPEKYMSHFPIHQDGSCNGLQHYAALGRDKAGAYSVNLMPSDIPQDVYSAVAALVEKSRKEDEKNGQQIAKILDGFVRRKVIKQTVMTTVYGVTRYGARLQIAKQLKDIDEFPKEWVWRASSYLTSKTFESLREMFTSTREIQDWFTECARLISNTCNRNVEWITPLGLPIVQPYNNRLDNGSMTLSKKKSLQICGKITMDLYEKPNTMKQKNAFPPNFIHSLDSSHMMLTSLYCERKGITFVSVHDCFWTHACTVPDMNKICREQFVALHSQPILKDLSKFLVDKYSFGKRDDQNQELTKRRLNKILKSVPKKGDFDLRDVLNSVYFFS